jgi:hypothetical protein
MRSPPIAVLGALLILAGVWLPAARAADSSPRIFKAVPGTNTLLAARDAVRAWRASGHPDEAAVIRLSPGQYALTEPLKLDARDNQVTWMARKAGQASITGGRRISGFTADADGIWHAHTDLHFEQLYINGRRGTRARFPIAGYFRMQDVRQEDAPNGKVRLTVKVAATNAAFLHEDPAALREAQLLVFHNWDTSRYRLASVAAAAGTFSVVGERMQPWNPWNAQSRFLLDNYAGGQPLPPGSWFLDDQGTLSYCPRNGERIAGTEFVAPVLDRFLEADGASQVHFENLRFQYTRYEMPPDGCPPAQAASFQGAAIEVDHARDVTFQHCEVAHTGSYGIWFQKGCHDGGLQACLLADLGGGGIRIGEMQMREDPREQTDGLTIDNNIIRGCGWVHPSAVAVWIGQSANNRITHNDISDTFYTAISVGWTWGYGRSLASNNFIGFNRIHRIGQGVLSDLGGIYTLGVSPGSASIGNVIWDVRAHDYGGWGIYPDEGSSDWNIESNLVWRCTCVAPHSGGAFHQHYGATNLIANNLFALSSGPPMQATRVENHRSFSLEHNLIVSSNAEFFAGPWDKIQFESGSNCYVLLGTAPAREYPGGDLAQWRETGHDAGSILTNCAFIGVWPDVHLPPQSPAYSIGFKMFTTETAGVYGPPAWRRTVSEIGSEPTNAPITPE